MDRSDYFIIIALVVIMVALLCNPPKAELPVKFDTFQDEYSILIATDTLKNIAILRLIKVVNSGEIEVVTVDTLSICDNIRYMRVLIRGE